MAQLPELLSVSGHWLLTGRGVMIPDLESEQRSAVLRSVLSATPEQLAEIVELVELTTDISGLTSGATVPPLEPLPEASSERVTPEAAERTHEAEERAHEEERKSEQLEAALERTEAELERLRRAAATPEHPDPDVSPIQSAPGWRDEDYETVRRYESEDVALAAGTGTFADREPVAGEVKFRTSWLRKRRLRAKDLFLVDVSGDSMEPTICDGDSALVDETHTSPRSGKIYALRTGDGPLVKRLRKRDHRWWADSDNDEYEPQPLDDRARIMGRVVWWAHTD